jgi:cyclic pyranopterin phosphate synthase
MILDLMVKAEPQQSISDKPAAPLVDKFGRCVDYVRISVTDRCDFRCVYCMAEEMEFLPRSAILSLEEIELVATAFVGLGVKKIRITGGEPLIRRNILSLMHSLHQLDGLEELVMTTNGSQLGKCADALRDAGVSRLNISIDSLQADKFQRITRVGKLDKVLQGIEAARNAGFKRIKLNAVIQKGQNDDEILDLVAFCMARDLDLTFIEEMPLGHVSDHSRAEQYCSSDEVRAIIESEHSLLPTTETSNGPSRYYRLANSPIRLGFISPHSHNFCALCNRVRLTAEGRLLLCLGNEHSVDLRAIVRQYPGELAPLQQAIVEAMELKPESHEFDLEGEPQIVRFMNMTGG